MDLPLRATTMVALLVVGGLLGVTLALAMVDPGTTGSLSIKWISSTGQDIAGNHHAAAAGPIAGQSMVYAPISGRTNSNGCALIALDGRNGSVHWRYSIPPANCTVHSIGDTTLADYDGDGRPEVLAATTQQTVQAFDARTGAVEMRQPLSSYGYSRPAVTNLTNAPGPEIIVVDVRGRLFVFRSDGTLQWSRDLDGFAWAQLAVADFDADGEPEVAIGQDRGTVSVLTANGTLEWNHTIPSTAAVTWLTTGQGDQDSNIEIYVATTRGEVIALDGAAGTIEWRVSHADFAAVHAFGDGDRDGDTEIYAVATDGQLRSIDAGTGAIEWTTTLTAEDVQMMPPPALGDLDGDGLAELAAVTHNGIVSVVDPQTGAVLAVYERPVAIYTQPTLANLDGVPGAELVVVYADGRVVTLSYTA